MALEDYQQKLEAFISVIPQLKSASMVNRISGAEYYGEVLSGTPVLRREKFKTQAEKDAYKKLVEAAAVSNNETFTTLSGLTHRGLLDNWKVGGQMTSCNGFTGKVGIALGVKGLGGFGMEATLRGLGKGHCWITPASGETPKYCDVFEASSSTPGQGYLNIHVGVSLRVEGGMWYTVEGGQGGPGSGVDKVARVAKPYDVSHILGWVDMKLLASGAPPMPDWLLGTWTIFAEKKNFYYRFDRYGDVVQLPFGGAGVKDEALPALDTGKVTLFGDTVEVHWSHEGGTEKFTYDRWNSFPGIMEKMTGVAADGTVVNGVRT